MPRYTFPAGTVTNTTGSSLRLTFHATSSTGRREADLWTIDASGNLSERIPNGVILADYTGAYAAFAGPDDVYILYLDTNDGSSRTAITTSGVITGQGAYAHTERGLFLPSGWDIGWRAGKASGSPDVANIGDSITAGVTTGSPTPDSLIYGYSARLESLLAARCGGLRAEFLPLYSYSPISGVTTSVSPFSNTDTGTASEFPSGIGVVQGPSTTSTWNYTIAVGAHPVTGASPTGMDLLTVDFAASQTWKYRVDGGSSTTITTSSSAGSNATAILRRTSVTMSAGAHSVQVGQTSAANTLFILGTVIYYGSTGLGFARQGISSWRAIDYAGGAGNGQGINGTNAQMPDRIKPWSGIQDANNVSGTDFPWCPDLAIVSLGLNDAGFGINPKAYERALTRFIHAFRAGNRNCSILFVATASGNLYSDNATSTFTDYATYKQIMRNLAEVYTCGYMDFDTLWESDPIATGMLVAGNPHPTSAGHLDMATRIAAAL